MLNKIYTKSFSKKINYELVDELFDQYSNYLMKGRGVGYLLFLEHQDVFTVGRFNSQKYDLSSQINKIPIKKSSRGGDITYHGDGQLVFYPILNVSLLAIKLKNLVSILEKSLVKTLENFSIIAKPRMNGPGVWIDDYKIASIGISFKKGISFHGISINFDTDLYKQELIDACGDSSLKIGNIEHFAKINKSKFKELFNNIFYSELINISNYPKKKLISLVAES
tara:strand:- start:2816 stop:3487 length:672 start_codon:yes stop_codon:yes gene_type:complete